jgi:hypothetical protein
MSTTIGTTGGGWTTRDPARSGRRAPVGLEALEPRILLASHVVSPAPGWLSWAPALVAARLPAAPQPDEGDELRIDLSMVAESSPAAVIRFGPMSTTNPQAGAATQAQGSPGTNVLQVPGTNRPRPASGAATPTSAGVTIGWAACGPATYNGPGSTVAGSGPAGSVPGSVGGFGPTSTGSGATNAGSHIGSVPGPPTSSVASVGSAPSSTNSGRSGAPAAPITSLSPPIGVGPLPSSQYEPAGGIFHVVGTAAPVARVEETRVEMSLVRLLSPGEQGSQEDSRPFGPDPEVPTTRLASDPAPPREVVVRTGSSQLAGGIADGPAPIAPDDLAWGTPPVPAATRPPIDEPDRPAADAPDARPRDAIDRGRRLAFWGGPGRAIFLGLSGPALLGVGLHAPDLAAALHRARPGQRSRRRSRGDRPGGWPSPPPLGD